MIKNKLIETLTCCSITFLYVFSGVYATEYNEEDFKSDWVSPLYKQDSQKTLLYGSTLTALLVLTRDNTVEPFQKTISEQEPLGDLAPIGDLMGQLVPNLSYMAYQYYYKKDRRRTNYMFKVSAFTGLTTFFSKRIINQRRPNEGDRNSFPSGHTSMAFAFAGVVALEHPQYAIASYGLASFVGFSRINDNAHYLHDVVMGATLGISYAYALRETELALLPLHNGAMIGWNRNF